MNANEENHDPSSMADWSELPKELLQLISERLESPLYILRFRSVCSSWRSYSSPIPIPIPIPNPNSLSLPFNFPILSQHSLSHNKSSTFSLSKRSLFLITPPQPLHPSWLIKISHNSRGRTLIYHPLSRSPDKTRRFHQPLDFYNLNVFDLGHEIVHADASNSLYMEKVVLLQNDRFALLTIHVSGKLGLFRSGDAGWTVIPYMVTPFDDVSVFKGKLCAVDNTGRAITVQFDSSVCLLAEPVFGGDKKFLVESQGELLLVDKYLMSNSSGTGDYFAFEDDGGDFDFDDDLFGWERAVRFDVYRLDEELKRWVEVGSLGDRVLFLGDDCAFSASATDLRVGKGNYVIFREEGSGRNTIQSSVFVFCLDDGRISPLVSCPGFSELFRLPPDWVALR